MYICVYTESIIMGVDGFGTSESTIIDGMRAIFPTPSTEEGQTSWQHPQTMFTCHNCTSPNIEYLASHTFIFRQLQFVFHNLWNFESQIVACTATAREWILRHIHSSLIINNFVTNNCLHSIILSDQNQHHYHPYKPPHTFLANSISISIN